MSVRRPQTDLLLQAGRLLLEYNESTRAIHRALKATAKALAEEPCHVDIAYRSVAVTLAADAPVSEAIRELRYNAAVQAGVHEILAKVRSGELDTVTALDRLRRVETDTPRHSRWLVAGLLGAAATSLAVLLGADAGAAVVAGVATALGLLARQELGRRHFSVLALPAAATFIGAVGGALAIRADWTRTPELALAVPALMVVPGPHIINGLLDLIDNYLPMSLSRLGLATGILLAAALGIVLAVELILPQAVFAGPSAGADRLNVVTDMALAGIVTCGFAAFYNTAWRHVGMAAIGGMVGHGLRFVALETGCRLEVATFLGGLAVGAVSAVMAQSGKTPLAVIAFAGAVTMIPGLNLYRALGGALQLARSPDLADPGLAATTCSAALQACVVIAGLVLGLILGARAVQELFGTRESSEISEAKMRARDTAAVYAHDGAESSS